MNTIDERIDLEVLSVAELEALRDACTDRLLALRRTEVSLPDALELLETIKTALRDRHKEWYGLDTWEWRDGALRFWLNPRDTEHYRPGWYTLDELIAWTHEQGPVLCATVIEA